MIKRTGLSIIASLLLSYPTFAQETLSEYEKFVSYPYLEKAYRYQAQKDFPSAIKEIKKAIEIAPGHTPYQVLLFEYYVASKQQENALSLYESLPEDARGTLLASLIENQIQDDQLTLSEKLRELLDNAPKEQRDTLYIAVSSRLIGKGEDTLVYEWLSKIETDSAELIATKIQLADKLGHYADVEKLFLQLNETQRTSELERIYALSLLRNGQVDKALKYADKNPSDTLSFDIYYQHLQDSIANQDVKATSKVFEWIAEHHQIKGGVLQQQFEFAIQTKDKKTAFAILPKLNVDCQKRVELALSFEWETRAIEELVSCQNNMEQTLWITYASTLLPTARIESLVKQSTRHALALSEVLINRYIASGEHQLAIDEIVRTNKQSDYTEVLALSYEKLGKQNDALFYWEKYYISQKTDSNLDKITFLKQQLGQDKEAIELLEQRLESSPQNMPTVLVSRLLGLYLQNSRTLRTSIVKSFMQVSNSHDSIAELLRINNNCKDAISLLEQYNVTTALGFKTRALCTDAEQSELALTHWQKAYALNPNNDSLRAIAYAQGEIGEIENAFESLNKLGKSDWTTQDYLFAAQLSYQKRNYEDAKSFWTEADAQNEEWLNFGVELAIQQQNYPLAQQLSQRLIIINNDLTAQQWARQATIYQRTDEMNKAIRAWQIANEKAPDNSTFKIAWAYSLIGVDDKKAYEIMQSVVENPEKVDTRTWEQLGYLAASNGDQEGALDFIVKSIKTDADSPLPRSEELSWLLHEYYRDISQNWRFTLSGSHGTGGILGEVFFVANEDGQLVEPPTNNVTARAEYFFNPLNKRWSAYAQLSGNGTDSSPLDDWSKELGVSYKLFEEYNIKATIGAQRFFSGDWEGLIRLNGDMLNQGSWRQGWRFDKSWWERQFYFDLLLLPESEQFLGLARFDIGYVQALNTQSKQTIKYYGLGQYDIRRPSAAINGQSTFDQGALGLGLQWRLFTTPDSPFERVHRYSLSLEWRINVFGDLTNDSNSLFIIGTYQY